LNGYSTNFTVKENKQKIQSMLHSSELTMGLFGFQIRNLFHRKKGRTKL